MVYDGEHEWDADCLNEMAGNPVSFAAQTLKAAFSDADQVIGSLSRRTTNSVPDLHRWFPHFVSGGKASRERLERFGEYSGRVSAAQSRPNPYAADGPVYSASAMETLGRCPLAFFFSRRLGIYPLDEVDGNLDRWLDAAQFGNLLHELFRRFMAELSTGERPVFDLHWATLRSQLKDIVDTCRSEIPPPTKMLFAKT